MRRSCWSAAWTKEQLNRTMNYRNIKIWCQINIIITWFRRREAHTTTIRASNTWISTAITTAPFTIRRTLTRWPMRCLTYRWVRTEVSGSITSNPAWHRIEELLKNQIRKSSPLTTTQSYQMLSNSKPAASKCLTKRHLTSTLRRIVSIMRWLLPSNNLITTSLTGCVTVNSRPQLAATKSSKRNRQWGRTIWIPGNRSPGSGITATTVRQGKRRWMSSSATMSVPSQRLQSLESKACPLGKVSSCRWLLKCKNCVTTQKCNVAWIR